MKMAFDSEAFDDKSFFTRLVKAIIKLIGQSQATIKAKIRPRRIHVSGTIRDSEIIIEAKVK